MSPDIASLGGPGDQPDECDRRSGRRDALPRFQTGTPGSGMKEYTKETLWTQSSDPGLEPTQKEALADMILSSKAAAKV